MFSKIDQNSINNIIVFRLNKVGDMICTLPFLKTLRNHFEKAKITVFTEQPAQEIMQVLDYINGFIIYKNNNKLFLNKYLESYRLINNYKKKSSIKKFDIAFGVKGGFSSSLALLTLISGASLRAGYVNKNHILRHCYNLPVASVDFAHTHQVETCLNILSVIGIKDFAKDISIEIPADFTNKVHEFIALNKISLDKPVILFNISNNREKSSWDIDKFIELGRILIEKHAFTCIISSTDKDEEQGHTLCRTIGTNAFYYKTKKLMDFAAIASLSSFVVAGDGGASHISAAAGAPVISIFGETNPAIWKPYGTQNIALQSKDKNAKSITLEDVLNSILSNLALLNKKKSGKKNMGNI